MGTCVWCGRKTDMGMYCGDRCRKAAGKGSDSYLAGQMRKFNAWFSKLLALLTIIIVILFVCVMVCVMGIEKLTGKDVLAPLLENNSLEIKTMYVSSPDGFLNLREGPSTKHKVLVTLPHGTSVSVYEEREGQWIKIRYNATIGFVNSKFLSGTKPQE